MRRLSILKILVLFLLAGTLSAQPEINPQHALKMIAHAKDGEVMLRWAPTTYQAWTQSNAVGYVVVRHTIMRNGQMLDLNLRSVPRLLTTTPLQPIQDPETWRSLMEKNDFAAIAAQSLFGKSFETTTPTSETNPEMMINAVAEQQNRFGFGLFSADHSFEVAQAMGLAFIDKDISAEEQYVYRVYPAGITTVAIDTGFTSVAPKERFQLPKVLEVQADFEDKRVTVSWNKQRFEQFYVSYQVERSEDGVTFETLHEKPFINPNRSPRGEQYAYYVDTFEVNNKPYFYRVKGRTPFEEYGPPSDLVQGMGFDPMPTYYPEISAILETEQAEFQVQWNFGNDEEKSIQGFYVQRADNDAGPYETISELIKPSVRTFTDPNPLPTNYYKVIGVDLYAREMPSYSALAQLYDATPPAPPVNVRGKIMKDGTMVITWDKNTAPDFHGNRVFMANNPNLEYTQITREPATKGYFIDTVSLNTLTEKVYVKVTSQDYRHNTSGFSEVAIISRPDTVAPSPPIFTAYETSSASINLEWANSSSSDLTATELRRRPQGSENWETIERFTFPEDANITAYEDTTAQSGIIYEYMLTAIDDADLRTDSKLIELKKLKSMIADPIEKVTAKADRRTKLVSLSWEYQDEKDLEYFKIYRGLDPNNPITYKTISKKEAFFRKGRKNKKARFRFEDDRVKMNTAYQYQVKAIYYDGAQSPKSEVVKINY